jgi:thiamine biosynthesis lipoprotein ApbE
MNPETGRPVEEMTSVSVSASSPVLAEMLSTAALAMKDEEITELIKEYEGTELIRVDYSSKEPDLMHLQTEATTE